MHFNDIFYTFFYHSRNRIQQDCIPVGCVPSAEVAVSPAMHAPLAMHTPLHHACPLPLHQTNPFYHECPHHLLHMPLLPRTPFTMHTPFATHAPLGRMTDACENITFPQLLLRAVISPRYNRRPSV